MKSILREIAADIAVIALIPLIAIVAIWMAIAEPAHPDEHFSPRYKP